MKISKSILSPGRSTTEISFSSSLSRRLKTNGSLKGGQSPMFPSTRKKTGAGFENPEPSSPKVTCIGQVRVKSKKKKTNHQHHHSSSNHNIRSRSQRRSADYSFRRIDATGEGGNNGLKRQSSTSYRNREIELESSQRHGHGHNNQKWVHIPVTICESLRSFGADFNCFLPCRSSEHQQQREAEKQGCGSVLGRWLVAVQEGEGEGGEEGGRQIELVVGGRDDDAELCGRRSYRKRHVMEDIDIKEIEKDLKERVGVGRDKIVEGGRRVSICVPPKNALLLMRCGSDPVKMAALANRLCQPPPEKEEEEEEEEEEEKDIHEIVEQQMLLVKEEDVGGGAYKECETGQAATVLVDVCDDLVVPETEESLPLELEMPETEGEDLCDKFVTEGMYDDVSEEILSIEGAVATGVEDSGMEHQLADEEAKQQFPKEEMMDIAQEEEADQLVTSPSSEQDEKCIDISMEQSNSESIKVDYVEEESDDEDSAVEEKKQDDTASTKKEKENSVLPDCLLLMMCEPKLSMEVSQETWVCTTDFIRWLPPREPSKTSTTKKKNDGGGEAGDQLLSKRVSIHYKPPTAPPRKAQENPKFTPPRSSCSYPAEHESACEPLYNLTRCKSEPRRAAAGQPESCFRKNRPHAPVGIGAAGMGF